MTLDAMHPEDVKAELRKRFGSVAKFERAKELPPKSVTDVLRGYKSARVEKAINEAICVPIQMVESDVSGCKPETRLSHRQNERGE